MDLEARALAEAQATAKELRTAELARVQEQLAAEDAERVRIATEQALAEQAE